MKFIKSPKFVWILAVVIYLIVGYLYYSGVYLGKAKKLKEVETALNNEKTLVTTLTIQVKDYDKIMAEKDSLLALWEVTKKHLPSVVVQEDWLKEIAGMATSTGIEITDYRPMPPVQHDLYKEYPVRVSVASGYHDLGTFVSLISNADRLMKVKGLDIRQSLSQDDPHQTVSAVFSISNYIYSPAPVPANKKAQRKGGKRR